MSASLYWWNQAPGWAERRPGTPASSFHALTLRVPSHAHGCMRPTFFCAVPTRAAGSAHHSGVFGVHKLLLTAVFLAFFVFWLLLPGIMSRSNPHVDDLLKEFRGAIPNDSQLRGLIVKNQYVRCPSLLPPLFVGLVSPCLTCCSLVSLNPQWRPLEDCGSHPAHPRRRAAGGRVGGSQKQKEELP